MTTKFSNNSFISLVSYKTLNHNILRAMLVMLLFTLGITNAWAGDSYYAQVTASANPTGAGSVYVKANATTGATTSDGASDTSPDKQNTDYNFALLAVTGYGYEFSQWALGANPSGGNQSLKNAGSRTTAYVTARTKNSNGTLDYTVKANFNRRAIAAAGVTETSLSSPQTWREHGSAATVKFEDKYVLNQSDITITYPTDISTVAKSLSWTKGTTDNNSDGAAVTNGKMTVTMTYDFSNPTALAHNPSATITVKEQMGSVSQTSSAVAIGLDLTPTFTTDKASHTFSAIEVNTTASTTINASSYGDLPINNAKCAWSYTLTGANANQFSCVLSAGVATVTYQPTAAGSHSASLTMTAKWTDANGTVLSYTAPAISISGSATAPDFAIGNLSYTTTTDVGAKTQTLTLTNISYVTSATIAFSGENASCFSATTYNTTTKSFDITFTPPVVGGKNQAGTYTATATVTGSAAASSAVRTCTLTAVVNPAPVASFTVPSAIVFNNGEDMADGATDDQTLTLTNIQNVVGTPTITITGTDASMYAVQGSYDSENNAFMIRFTAGGTKGGRLTADATVMVANYDGETISKTVTLNAFMEEVVAFEARVTKANGDVIKEGTWAECLTAANNNAGSTLTLMKNIDLGTITATNNISKAMTIDLNGKELRAAVNATSIGVLTITAAVPVTIKDSRTGGKIINEIARNSEIRTIFVNKAGATLTLESGTIAVNNLGQYASAANADLGVAKYANCAARAIHQIAGSTVNINGGKIEAYGTRSVFGIVQASSVATNKAGTTVLNITGGEIYAEAPYGAYGLQGYGKVNFSGGNINVKANTNMVDARYAADNANNKYNGLIYGILISAYANATAASCYYGTLNMTGGNINVTNERVGGYDRKSYGVLIDCSNASMGANTAVDGSKCQKAAAKGSIDGGTITVNSGTYYSFGVYMSGSYNSYDNTSHVLTVKNCTIDVKAHTYAYGVFSQGAVNSTNGGCYHGDIELTNCDVTAETTVGAYSYAAFVTSRVVTIYKNASADAANYYHGEYGSAGKLTINSGTYKAYSKTTTAYCVSAGNEWVGEARARTVYADETNVALTQHLGGNVEAYPTLIIHGGDFYAETYGTTTARAVSSGGYTTIDGGTFKAVAKTNNAYGLVAVSGTMKATGITVEAEGNATVYGVLVNAGISDYTLFDYAADVELNNCDVTATTRTGTEARGVSVVTTTKTQTEATKETLKTNGTKEGATSSQKNAYNNYYNIYQIGEKAVAAKVKINGGTYRATAATTTAYGVVVSTTSVSATGAAHASAEGTIKNATFVVKTNGTTSATGIYAGGPTTIEGCNITVQPKTTTGYGVYINDKKTTLSNTTINVTTANTADATKSAAAYGIYNYASISSIGWIFEGELEANEGNVVDVKTTSGTTAYGIWTHAVYKAITSEVYTAAGTYPAAARTVINGGKYTANANNTTAYALGVQDPQRSGDVAAIPTCIVNGGNFKGTATTTPYADVSVNGETGYFVLNGGYYVKDENLDKKLGEGMNKVAVKSGTPEYTEGYRWRVTDNMTGEYVCKIKENSTSYASLEEALQVVNATPNSTWTIIMIANYTLSKGDYEIPANTTLLIPYKSGQTTINGTTPAWVDKRNTPTPTTPSPYMKLTFANGVNMTVKGKIEASSTTYINQNNWTGVPGGPYGWLQLNEGSHIDLESGAYLFAWGYVTGTGDINAKNGSYIYEDFQMGDWRGGTISSDINGNKNGLGSKGVFLLTDYYFQNVECPITYRPGAKAIAYSGCYMEKANYGLYIQGKSDPVTMVGTSGAMFLMSPATAGENTWVRKEYDSEKDQLVWTLNSGASLGSFRLKISASFIDVDMTTSDYVLPMATNFKIVANEGDINITNDICFLPGSEAIVNKEANLVVASGKRVFVYDSDDWSSYGGYYHKIGYSPSWKACPRTATKLPDAKIEIAGTLTVNGSIYTTAGGGNIFSTRENSGKIKFNAVAPASTEAIAQFTGTKNTTLCQIVGYANDKVQYVGKALTSAKLKNEDGEYTPTTGAASGEIYAYMEDPADGVYRWLSVKDNGCFTEIKGADTKQYIHPSDFVAVEENANGDHAYHNLASTRMFVNAEAASTNASCVWWEVNPTPEVIDAVTYYVANNENFDNFGTYYYWDNSVSYWKPKKVTVIWNDKDGNKITNGTFGDEYNFNTSPQFFGTNPTWANSATEKHDWIGWRDAEGNIYDKNATLPRATSNVTYTAYFNTSKFQYTITFKNDDNSDLWAGLVDAGTTGDELQALFETKYNEKTGSIVPQKAPTVDKVFTFTGWNTTLATVTAAATYTAQYSYSTRQYHVTFYNYDAVSVLYEADVNYNTSPTYSGVTPFRANTSAYSYNWTGWQQGATTYTTSATLPVVKGDISYIATFEQTELKYQVFFKRQNGSIIDAPFFSYEETPAAFPANPTMASTVSTDYTFREWSPATLVPVTEDGMVYTALFDESPRQYTAHFVNYNGVSLNVDQTIDYSTVPAYTGVTPMKPNDSRNSYVFSGWAWTAGEGWEAGSVGLGEALPAIKGEITFTAQYTPTLLQFDVIYQREDGTVILRDKKKWGENSAFPTSGLDYEDATYTYTFDHWNPATVVNPVTTNATYTAYYNQSIKTYSITAVGISPAGYGSVSPASLSGIPADSKITVDGNKLTVNGSTITATPTAADAQYTYTFDHWNNVPATITGNISTIEAVFTRTVNTYTVTWKNADGTVLETDENVDYGTTPTYDGETPTKDVDASYVYTFNTWTPAVGAISGDATYTATYNTVPTVASVTVSDNTTYYASVADAITFANGKTDAVVTILQDDAVESEITISAAMTIDLNGKTISSTNTTDIGVFKISASGKTVTIRDSGTNGKISRIASSSVYMSVITLDAGSLSIKGGTIYAENTNATSNTAYRAIGIYNKNSNAISLSMSGGTIEAKRPSTYAYGMYLYNTNCTLTVSGGEIKATGTSGVRGIYQRGGKATLSNTTITATATVAGDGNGYALFSDNSAKFTINSGTYTATGAAKDVYAIYAKNASVSATVNGGQFSGKSKELEKTAGTFTLKGGYYVHNTDLEANCATNYHVLPLTGEDPYMYEVAEAYTITFKNGDDVLQSSAVKKGETPAYTGTPTKPEDEDYTYTFIGWDHEIAAVSAAATYTAQFNQVEKEVGTKLDIVEWTSNGDGTGTLTLNLNGIPAAGWPYTINGTVYNKEKRAADRTLTIPYSGSADTKLTITVKDKDNITYSRYKYIIPHVYGSTANLEAMNSASSIIVVNNGTLTVKGDVVVNAIYVGPEAELVVNSGVKLTVNSLMLRTTPWKAASLDNKGTIEVRDQAYYTRIIADNSKYFQFAIPLASDVKNVRLSNNSKCTYNTSWMLKSYDEESRAKNGAVNTETISNWKLLEPNGEGHATILGSVGYEMFSNTPYYREYYFPVALPETEATVVGVSYHLEEAGEKHAGWNALCSPLMRKYPQAHGEPDERLKISLLNPDGTYQQTAPDIIYPAVPFYYQATHNGKIYFNSSAMVFSAPRRAWNAYVPTQWMQLAIRNLKGDKLDETSIYAHPEKFAPEYETGYDVAKQSLTGGKALIYSELPCGKLAFAAVPDSLAEQRIPLTIYAATQEEYVFSLAENNYLGRLQHVFLHDTQNGLVIDLLERDYATEINAGTNAGRFYIQCVFAAEAPAVTTGVNSVESNDDAPQKIMYKNKVYIIYQGRVYDMTGRQCELR
jgi:hypothetical protein